MIYSIHSRKEKRLRETKYKADSDYSKRNLEIVENDELNYDQKQAERQKARDERDDVYKEVDDKIKVLDKRYNAIVVSFQHLELVGSLFSGQFGFAS